MRVCVCVCVSVPQYTHIRSTCVCCISLHYAPTADCTVKNSNSLSKRTPTHKKCNNFAVVTASSLRRRRRVARMRMDAARAQQAATQRQMRALTTTVDYELISLNGVVVVVVAVRVARCTHGVSVHNISDVCRRRRPRTLSVKIYCALYRTQRSRALSIRRRAAAAAEIC